MNVFGLVASVPLVISIVGFAWAKFFGDDERFPGGAFAHGLLVVTQFVVVSSFYLGWNLQLSSYFLSALYMAQAVGVTVLVLKKGDQASCGCFGSQIDSKLSWKLIVFNIAFGGLAFIGTDVHFSLSMFEGALFLGIAMLLGLFFVIGVPDGRYAIRGFRVRAKQYYRIVTGYKELLP